MAAPPPLARSRIPPATQTRTELKTISFFVSRLANKLQPGAVKVNDLSKVSNPAMRTNKEVRIQCVVAKELSFPDPFTKRQKVADV